ncbi:hypothetical protein HDU78_005330 [Chytriomyces hyalinus]|nr:hypothetical protein HDU78_005330 [Chytriomyces hyalinus]
MRISDAAERVERLARENGVYRGGNKSAKEQRHVHSQLKLDTRTKSANLDRHPVKRNFLVPGAVAAALARILLRESSSPLPQGPHSTEFQTILSEAFEACKRGNTLSAIQLHSDMCHDFSNAPLPEVESKVKLKPLSSTNNLQFHSDPLALFSSPITSTSPSSNFASSEKQISLPNLISSEQFTQHWKLVRYLSHLLIRSQNWASALQIITLSAAAFPLTKSESISLLIPFLNQFQKQYLDTSLLLYPPQSADAFETLVALARHISADASTANQTDSTNMPSYTGWILQLPQEQRTIIASIVIKSRLLDGEIFPAMSFFKHLVSNTPLTKRDIAVLWGSVVHGLCLRNLPSEAMAVLREIQSPPVSAITPVLESMARQKHVDRLFDFLAWFLYSNGTDEIAHIDERAFQIAYWGCLEVSGWWGTAFVPNKSVWNSGRRQMKNPNILKEARKLFLRYLDQLMVSMSDHDRKATTSVAHSAIILEHVYLKNRFEAEQSLEQSVQSGIDISPHVLKQLVQMYPTNSDTAAAIQAEIDRLERPLPKKGNVLIDPTAFMNDLASFQQQSNEFESAEFWRGELAPVSFDRRFVTDVNYMHDGLGRTKNDGARHDRG